MLGCQAYTETGAPAPLTGITVSAQVWPKKEGSAKVADLEVVFLDQSAGSFELWAPGDSCATNWPVGELAVDVQYSQTVGERQIVRSTETFYILIERDITT